MIGDRIEVNIAGGLDVPLPRMVNVRQKFQTSRLESVTKAIAEQFARAEVRAKIKPGAKIAVGCGSRGVANIAEAARAVVAEIKKLGGDPFIFPAMGSHGSATAEGQKGVLEGYGIVESYVGCPIRATMDTVVVGECADGTPVHIDRFASEADGIVLINRVKPHTNFRAPIESGIVKMIGIGMGKITGATTLHTHGMDRFDRVLPEVARVVLAKKNFLLGIGMVENAHDETAIIEAIPAEQLFERETELQTKAKAMIGRLMFDEIDVLLIDEIGKNISGSGADPNVTGRNIRGAVWEAKPRLQKIVMLGLTKETKGNATGMGAADVITMRFFKDIDLGPTYANVITSAYLDGAAIPMIMNNDHDAIALAVKSTLRVKPQNTRIVRIQNTLRVTDIQVSEPLLQFVKDNPSKFEILSEPAPFQFDAAGRIAPLPGGH
jgi:Lactate racemase N-terminal domain